MKKLLLIIPLLVFIFLMKGCKKDDKLPDPVSDAEGNSYQTVRIGDQVWMAENLRSTRLNDGTDIPLAGSPGTWAELAAPAYCWYNNDEPSYKNIYGALYNGYTVSSGKICPTGWHIPDKEEWINLGNSLGDSLKAGGSMKESGTEHWLSPNKGADNSSGFTAMPAGLRYFEGTFAAITNSACFWSSTENSDGDQWYAGLFYTDSSLTLNHRNKKHGFSIRCIKD